MHPQANRFQQSSLSRWWLLWLSLLEKQYSSCVRNSPVFSYPFSHGGWHCLRCLSFLKVMENWKKFKIIASPFVLFYSNPCIDVCCLSHQRFSASYLLKLFLLPQRVHTTLFIRCDKTEHTRWCLCSLHAGIPISPDEVMGSRDSCCHSIAESTVDVPIRLFWQISSARTALFSCPFA